MRIVGHRIGESGAGGSSDEVPHHKAAGHHHRGGRHGRGVGFVAQPV